MNIPVSVKVGTAFFADGNFHSTNLLSEAGLWKADEIVSTSILTKITQMLEPKSPFMFMNVGNGQLWTQGGVELTGNGQWTWEVAGEFKQHSRIVAFSYTNGTDKPGINNSHFKVCLEDRWMKRGWIIKFEDGYIGRIVQEPKDKGTYWEYLVQGIYPDESYYCSTSNLQIGKYVKEGVYPVSSRLSIGTSDNAQTFPKATDQLGHFRWSERITGNVANAKVTTVSLKLPGSGDGKPREETYWMPYVYTINRALQEYKLAQWLMQDSVYNRDSNGVIRMKDLASGGEPIPMGASMRQKIFSYGNYASYGNKFTMEFFDKTFGDITYNVSGKKVDFVGHCGTQYADDFHNAIMLLGKNNGFQVALGENLIRKGSDGLEYGGTFRQYITPQGHRLTLMIEPFLDAVEDRGRTITHPRTNKPISSHSCYWLPKGLNNNGMPMVRVMTEKGRAFMHGVYRGFTPLPSEWGGSNQVGTSQLMQLATERDEASVHYWRTIGLQLDNLEYCFYHYSSIDAM